MSQVAVVYESTGASLRLAAKAVAIGVRHEGGTPRMIGLSSVPDQLGKREPDAELADSLIDQLSGTDCIALVNESRAGVVTARTLGLLDVLQSSPSVLPSRVFGVITIAGEASGGQETALALLATELVAMGLTVVGPYEMPDSKARSDAALALHGLRDDAISLDENQGTELAVRAFTVGRRVCVVADKMMGLNPPSAI